MQTLFSWNFQKKKTPKKLSPIISKLSEIDDLIKKAAPDRPLEGINQIDLSILRLSTFDLLDSGKIPYKVVIDEAVELGKEFGSDSSSSFINGVLGKIVTLLDISD